jgi:uncharacterized protein YndB with AHSA1/START domain
MISSRNDQEETMPGTTAVHIQDSVVAEIEIDASPERVFAALTDPAQLFVWWGKEPSNELTVFEMDARPGGHWRFSCRPVAGADHGEVAEQLKRNQGQESRNQEYEAHGEVVEYDPPRLLVWSWIANWHEHPEQATIVRWELTPTESGTLVQVTHTALAQEAIARKDYGNGWKGVLRLLEDFILER